MTEETRKSNAIGYAKGRRLTIMLTGGQAHDCPADAELIARTKPGKAALDDQAYDSAELRASLSERGTRVIISNKCNRRRKSKFSKKRCGERHQIESAFFRLKDFRRIETRYDKLAANFAASVFGGRLGLVDLISLEPSSRAQEKKR